MALNVAVSKSTIFYYMHPESSGMHREAMLDAISGGNYNELRDLYTENISKLFTWGTVLKDWVIEAKLFDDERVSVVGNPRYDFYRVSHSAKKQGVGIMSSFTGLTNFDNRNILEAVDNGRGMGGVHYSANGGYEDFLWAAAGYARIFYEFLDIWCLDLKRNISFRTYPLESLRDMVFFKKKYEPYIWFNEKKPFDQWLLTKEANIFCYSSSIAESLISGVPYICVQDILGKRLDYLMPRNEVPDTRGDLYNYAYRPNSVKQLVEFAESALHGNLPMPVDPNIHSSAKKMLSEYYGFPSCSPASELIADSILLELRTDRRRNNDRRIKWILPALKSPLSIIYDLTNPKARLNFADYHYFYLPSDVKRHVEDVFEQLSSG